MLTQKLNLPADSWEVEKDFQLRKLSALKEELSMLNILEHPRQIQVICRKIVLIKNLLAEIEKR